MMSVSTKVTAMTDVCNGPVLTTDLMRAGLIAFTPTTMSSPASAGIATYDTTPEARRMTSDITTAPMNSARRVRAPAATISADADIEPPTGMPRNTPETMLPTPWPMKLRESSAGLPSAFGTPAATAAPCTRPTNASESAGTARYARSSKVGSTGIGRPVGTSATSPTVSTSGQSKT